MINKNENQLKAGSPRARIMLSGGGTGGSVTPLIAIVDFCRRHNENYDFLFVGTKKGPEKEILERENIPFFSITSGKWRRYFSWQNFIDLFKIKLAFWQSIILLKKTKPDLIMSAGGFVSVPLVWAAGFWRIPVIIHQQDLRAGLANKLMAPFAKAVTVTFEKSLKDYGEKAQWIGNPTKELKIINSEEFKKKIIAKYNLRNNLPLILIIGGGTGSAFINDLIISNLENLTKFSQIIHVTGKNKSTAIKNDNYFSAELIPHNELLEIEVIADLIVSRCGLGALTELSALGKPSILIPMPNSHQEDNAEIFSKNNAARVLFEKNLTPAILTAEISELLDNADLKNNYGQNIKMVMKSGATISMIKIIKNLIG